MPTALRGCLVAATALLLTQSALAGGRQPAAPHARPAAAKAPVPALGAAKAPAITKAPATRQPAPAIAPGPEVALPIALTGLVLRADGQPCPGAAVYVAGAARELVVTDAQGAFRLPGVVAGKPVTVLADYFGLGSTRLVVASPGGQPLRLTIGQ